MADNGKKDEGALKAIFRPDMAVYYSNVISVATSVHDLRLTFGKGQPGEAAIYDVAIYLPHTTAKQLAAILTQALGEYEEEFGIINLEPVKKNGK